MRRLVTLAILGAVLAAPVACTQIDRAVKGFQSGPGGWQMAGQARTEMSSDVQYLGASADGAIIVRMSDGTTQIWSTAR
jgi:hypothetical protein